MLTDKYEIDPKAIPLLDFEIQVLVAAMNEYGFDKTFLKYLQNRGIDLSIFRPKFVGEYYGEDTI